MSAIVSTPRWEFLYRSALGKVLWRSCLWRFRFFANKEEAILEQDEAGNWEIKVVL